MESLAFAKQFKDWIAEEVRTQIAKATPRRRIAQVAEMDPDTRRAGVVYVGESIDNVVSLPYNSTAPTGIGQHVIVDGPPGDRSIVDVIGADDAERRLDNVAATSPTIPVALGKSPRLSESFPMTMRPNTPNDDGYRFSLAAGIPVYVPVQITHTADYERLLTSFTFGAANTTGVNMALYKYMLEEAGEYDNTYDMVRIGFCSITSVDSPPQEHIMFRMDDSVHLEQGDVVVVGIFYTGSPQMHVRAISHTPVPFLHIPPYTVAWASSAVSVHPEIVRHNTLAIDTRKTVYAGLFH